MRDSSSTTILPSAPILTRGPLEGFSDSFLGEERIELVVSLADALPVSVSVDCFTDTVDCFTGEAEDLMEISSASSSAFRRFSFCSSDMGGLYDRRSYMVTLLLSS